MKEVRNVSKGDLIAADLYSRPNAMTGKYRACQLGLENIKNKDVFFLKTLRMKADLADKMIAEAESQGKDTSNPEIMKDLGKKINSMSTPIHRSESVMTTVFVLVGYVGITLWLNSIRATANLSFVWVLIVVQLVLYCLIFVTSHQYFRVCGYKRLGIAPFIILAILGRVENWELFIIPLLIIVMFISSTKRKIQ